LYKRAGIAVPIFDPMHQYRIPHNGPPKLTKTFKVDALKTSRLSKALLSGDAKYTGREKFAIFDRNHRLSRMLRNVNKIS